MSHICAKCGMTLEIGMWPLPCKILGDHDLSGSFIRNSPNVHKSERSVIDVHHATGKISVPGRADRPMHPKQAAAGYERVELNNWSDVRFLESKGLVHEASNFDKGKGDAKPGMGTPDVAPKSAAELGLL